MSASTVSGCGGSVTVSSWPMWSIRGRLISTALLDDQPQLDRLLAEFQLARGDAGHVQQVIDQPHDLIHLPLHQGVGLLVGLRVGGEAEDLQGVADRGERVAKLMGQHGEELVLAAVGVPQRLFRALAVGDLAVAATQAEVLAPLPEDGLAGLGQPADRAVPVDDAELELDAGRGGHQSPASAPRTGRGPPGERGAQQVRVGEELGRLVPADPLARRGDVQVAPVGARQNSKS